MTLHIHAALVTGLGTAANNRGLTEGNIATLQKLVWNGAVHSTVSAEAIRFALRRRLADIEPCNRHFDEDTRANKWQDADFSRWDPKSKDAPFIDDDLLGFMSAKVAAEEGGKGTITARRAVLEVTRAVSLDAWLGDVTFNAASPGATPCAQKKGSNPVPYGTEMHATRYQFGISMTPEQLREPSRAAIALEGLCHLGPVAGNHGRFLFDFSPEAAVFRITHDPAPRLLYCFGVQGSVVTMPALLRKLVAGDLEGSELIVGGAIAVADGQVLQQHQATVHAGVLAALKTVEQRLVSP